MPTDPYKKPAAFVPQKINFAGDGFNLSGAFHPGSEEALNQLLAEALDCPGILGKPCSCRCCEGRNRFTESKPGETN